MEANDLFEDYGDGAEIVKEEVVAMDGTEGQELFSETLQYGDGKTSTKLK